MTPALLWTLVGAGALFVVGFAILVKKSWHPVPSGKALVVMQMNARSRVVFEGGAMVLPIVHRAELIDISVKLLKVRARARASDDSRVEIGATCYVRINRTIDDVQRVASSVGCERASSMEAIEQLFVPKFTDAIVTVAAHFSLEEMRAVKRDIFKDQIIMVIGQDLNGFVLDDVALDRVEAAAMEAVGSDEVGWRP
jgi:uncharacterized membrane protein YqiK